MELILASLGICNLQAAQSHPLVVGWGWGAVTVSGLSSRLVADAFQLGVPLSL